MSCCDVRVWGVASESDKVNQRTNVQEGARKRVQEREREKVREREREREREKGRERERKTVDSATVCRWCVSQGGGVCLSLVLQFVL